MNHLKTLLASLIIAYSTSLSAQGVGIGTNTPVATLNVAEHKTVLFGKDTTGAGGKLMWLPSKYCFRAGVTGPIYGVGGGEYDYGNPAVWDYDSLGYFSFAGGFNNLALGNSSVALGGYNQARGEFSVALGNTNKASGNYSFAAGIVAVASRYSSVAIGQGAKSLHDNATAIGLYVEASGNSSLATGHVTKASGFSSVSTGYYTKANAYYATAMGEESIANATNSLVIGRFNDTIAGSNLYTWVNSDPLFMIGNGSSNTSRKNAMIILKNGSTGFGTNTPTGLMHLKFNASKGIPNLMLEETGNDYARITFKNANPGFWDAAVYTQQIFGQNVESRFAFYCNALGGNVLLLKGNGDATLAGTLTQSSDERLKQNIQPISHALDKVMLLNGYIYQWKDPARGANEQIGVLAQEVEKQFPQLVHTDEEGMKSVAYSNMIPILIEAIQEQQIQIEELRVLLENKVK